MSRIIKIDLDTSVGYSYLSSKFFCTNKGTTTYRSSKEEILKVVDVVAPNTVTKQQLINLKNNKELLQELQYTWSDDGKYMKTLQINDYEDYYLLLDCEKQKLSINNSSIIYDLTIKESLANRVSSIQAYYDNTLGIDITTEQMTNIYSFIISFYNPYIYNSITAITKPLTYSNKFGITNYEDASSLHAIYTCTCNPNDKEVTTLLSDILTTNSSNNTITLLNQVQLNKNDKISIIGATSTDSYQLSCDGEYTVQLADKTLITTNENIPYSYSYDYPTCSLIVSSSSITNISRDNFTITLLNPVSNTLQVGSIIHVVGTQQEIEGTTVTCDGEYTISSIQNNIITVQEPLPTNYTYTTGEYPQVSKHLELGKVNSISNKYIYFTTNLPAQPQDNSIILLYKDDTISKYTVISSTTNSIRVSESIEDFTPTYPKLYKVEPAQEILISVTKTNSEELFPTTEFIVDNFTQCQKYLKTYLASTEELKYIPTINTYNLVNKEVPTSYPNPPITGIPTTLKGIYSEVYNQS